MTPLCPFDERLHRGPLRVTCLCQLLEPAANFGLVAAVVIAELRFEIALLAGNHRAPPCR